MENLKIIIAIGLLVTLSVVVTAIAYASFANASKTAPVAYNYNTPGYQNNPYGGNTYPAYPNSQNYPYSQDEGEGLYPRRTGYSYYPPAYGYPYGSYGEREGGYWGGE